MCRDLIKIIMRTQRIIHASIIAAILSAIIVLFSCKKEKTDVFPTVITLAVTDITESGATIRGNVANDGGSEISARGAVWSTDNNPTIKNNQGITSDGTGLGEYAGNITGLTESTTYFVRAYAINKAGTSYGNEVSFQTLQSVELATVATVAVTNITHNSATSGGNITNDGGGEITARGVVWSTGENPTLEDNQGYTEDDTNASEFESTIAEIAGNTLYYLRAYATNSAGTAYGSQETFATYAFYDDFTDNRNGWFTNDESHFFHNGYYHANYHNPGYFRYASNSIANMDFSGDFTMEMSFIVHSIYEPNYSWTGLLWNISSNPRIYRLLSIHDDGYVMLSDYQEDAGWNTIYSEYAFSGYGANNEIVFSIKKTGNIIDVYINQTRVTTIYSVPPDIISNSRFGLPVGSMHVAFDWIKIYGDPNQKKDSELKETTIDFPLTKHGFQQVLAAPER